MAISGIYGERSALEPPPREQATSVTARSAKPEAAFAHALRGVAREIDVGERQTAGATQLRSYDTASLIALQAGIYRYTEAVDLASKIVDRATSAVKTVLQGGGH